MELTPLSVSLFSVLDGNWRCSQGRPGQACRNAVVTGVESIWNHVIALDGGAATVGREDRTGHVAGLVRGKEGDDLGDLVDLGAPSQQ